MTDRVYPAGKPNPPPAAMNGTANGTANGAGAGLGPAKTTQLYNPNRPRPMYRPQPNNRRRSCSCRKFCCLCFLYTLIIFLTLLLLAAIAACIFYVLYHPKHPTFSVTSLRVSTFNLSSPDPSGFQHLATKLDFTLTAKNPNKKNIVFVYEPMSINIRASGVDAGNSTVPGFTHVAGNTTILRAVATGDQGKDLDTDTVNPLKNALSKNKGFPLMVELNTKVEVKMGKLKSKKVGIRVTCDGVRAFPPKDAPKKNGTIAKSIGTPAVTTNAKCKVDLRIKIWKFTF